MKGSFEVTENGTVIADPVTAVLNMLVYIRQCTHCRSICLERLWVATWHRSLPSTL